MSATARRIGVAVLVVTLMLFATAWRSAESTHDDARRSFKGPASAPSADGNIERFDEDSPTIVDGAGAPVAASSAPGGVVAPLATRQQQPPPPAVASASQGQPAWLNQPQVTNPRPHNCQSGMNIPLPEPNFYSKHPSFPECHRVHRKLLKLTHQLIQDAAATAKADEGPLLQRIEAMMLEYRAVAMANVRPNPEGYPAGVWYHGMPGVMFNRTLQIEGVPEEFVARNDLPKNLKIPATPRRSANQALDLYQFAMERHVADALRALPLKKPKAVVDLGARSYNASLVVAAQGANTFTSSLRHLEEHVQGFAEADVLAYELDQQFIGSFDEFVNRRHASGASGKFMLNIAAAWTDTNGMVSVQSSMKSSADFCKTSKKCLCFPTIDFPAVIERYPPRSVVLKMDIEGAEWVLVKSIIDRGVADRIAALFLECHHQRSAQNAKNVHADHWFAAPQFLPGLHRLPVALQRQWWNAIVGLGMECYIMHDMLRSHGIATYEWP